MEAEKLSETGYAASPTKHDRGEKRGYRQVPAGVSFGEQQTIKRRSRAFYILRYTLNVHSEYQKALETAEQGLRVAKAAGVRATRPISSTKSEALQQPRRKKKSARVFRTGPAVAI